VLVQIYQASADGKPVTGTLQEKIIARQVTADLSEELADTRLAHGEQMALDYLVPHHPDAQVIVMRVHVEPDYFYSGLYHSLLETGTDGKGTSLLRTALKNSLESSYDLYVQRYSLWIPSGR